MRILGIRPGRRDGLLADAGGSTYVEYLTLLAVVALVGSTAIVALGLPLLRTFRFAQAILTLPIP